ncbi:dynactin subunit 3 [Strongylocentrotus purpuratus]|uniref:Dynactin subunit 3 n=1 Tax=Strongylocentrotus purpuratus TaxID=7668 RepID=A0A7M7RAG0_STRPU|nr:dynactin subunit 3 [Strongylocentrotus purpuratus]|eukprot:XP_782749.2 PREDICTED: dynactin subunit 3 [Strongylocentrotus purpuratus]
MAGAGTLEILEQRIAALESRICGEGNSNGIQGSVIDNLHGVKQKIAGLTSGKSKTQALWKRLEELNNYLDPELSSQLTLSNDAKTDIILAEEEQLKAQAVLLEKVKELSSVLDSEHIKGVSGLSDRLVPLTTVQVKHEEEAKELGDETKKLLESYNNIITLISKQFVQWDEVMTKYEVAHKVRTPDIY